jgi:hypothetical protein
MANQRGNSAANQGNETQPAQNGGEPEGSNPMDCPSDGMGGTTDGEDSQRTRSGDSARQHGQQLGTTANQRGNSAANQGNETQPAQHGGEPEGSNLTDSPSDGAGRYS